MKNRRISLLLLCTAVSCAPASQLAQDYQRDSVTVTIRDSVIFRDSILYVRLEAEKDSVVIPDTDTSRLSTIYAESEAYVFRGRLHHSLRNRSDALIPVETKIPVTIHFESKSSLKDRHSVEVVEVEKQLSRWQRFIQAIGYIAVGFIVGWIALKILKYVK
jgi:hypothetical protein